jgi:hypothetical protein
LASARESEQFRQEARTVATLLHPNIIRVLDFDVEEATLTWCWTTRPMGRCASASLRQPATASDDPACCPPGGVNPCASLHR